MSGIGGALIPPWQEQKDKTSGESVFASLVCLCPFPPHPLFLRCNIVLRTKGCALVHVRQIFDSVRANGYGVQGLECWQRKSSTDTVPGCANTGYGTSGSGLDHDYCFDPVLKGDCFYCQKDRRERDRRMLTRSANDGASGTFSRFFQAVQAVQAVQAYTAEKQDRAQGLDDTDAADADSAGHARAGIRVYTASGVPSDGRSHPVPDSTRRRQSRQDFFSPSFVPSFVPSMLNWRKCNTSVFLHLSSKFSHIDGLLFTGRTHLQRIDFHSNRIQSMNPSATDILPFRPTCPVLRASFSSQVCSRIHILLNIANAAKTNEDLKCMGGQASQTTRLWTS